MSGENKYNCEHLVEKKPEGTYKMQRRLMALAYCVVPILVIVLLASFMGWASFVFVPIFFVLARPVFYGTWRYVNYQQCYEIRNAGTMRFTHYYGKKFKTDKGDEHADEHKAEKFILEMKIKDFEMIAPYNVQPYRGDFDALGIPEARIINHTSSPSHPNIYYGVYTNEAGEKCAILFDMIEKSLGIISYYNRKTVVTELHYAGEKLG